MGLYLLGQFTPESRMRQPILDTSVIPEWPKVLAVIVVIGTVIIWLAGGLVRATAIPALRRYPQVKELCREIYIMLWGASIQFKVTCCACWAVWRKTAI
jgi:hypothetical protein